ncbi:MAG: hypothetical protein HYY03_01850 [Chloroflexi bacterium]|nr:hypothetical protein [Chloroflexota bacterium]
MPGKPKPTKHGADPEASPPGLRRFRAPLILVAVLVAGAAGGALLFAGLSSGGGPRPKTAAIVDQLSLTQPNPDFVSSARDTLTRAGYVTDYFPGQQVTVDLYRTLPQRRYDLVILRVHAGITTEVDATSGQKTETEYVSLFTGEAYNPGKYSDEQLNRLGKAVYYEGAEPLFGIGPRFIEESMEGRFDKTAIVMMGCDGLRSQRTAEAFLNKGAGAFVSWSKPVSAAHTDRATERLLEKLLMEGLPAADAVAQTAAEVGPDPTYGAELRILGGG